MSDGGPSVTVCLAVSIRRFGLVNVRCGDMITHSSRTDFFKRREAGGQTGIRHKAWVADTSVTSHGVYAVSIGTNSLNLALINIDTASGIHPLIA